MNNSKEKFAYLYNLDQINYYLSKGICPLEMGIHFQSRRTWCKFSWDGTTNVFSEWCNRKNIMNKMKEGINNGK